MGLTEPRLRAAIIGCGRMGGTIDDEVVHYPAIVLPYSHAATYAAVEGVALTALADVDRARLDGFGTRWQVPLAHRYDDYRAMIERERPDLVSITTPATSHAEIAVFAAAHGVRGIWCEKAMACSLAECDAMVAAVERHGVKFNLGTTRRWHPAVSRLCDLLAGGALGRLQAIVAYGGGPLLHSGSHSCDLLLRFADDAPVEWVQGTVHAGDWWDGRSSHVPRDLAGTGQVRFATGVMGYYLAGGPGGEFEVLASDGIARIRNNGDEWELWRRGPRAGWDRPAFNPAPFPAFPRLSRSVTLLADLRDAVRTGKETLGNARVARAGTELALGIVESHRRGGARVACPVANRELYMVSK
jgi:predicted dehydrogenase